MHKANVRLGIIGFVFLYFLSSSCTSYKHVPYFEDLPDTTGMPVLRSTVPFKNPVIQTDDVLTITVQTIDNDVTNLLNSNSTLNGVSTSLPVLGSSTSTPSAGAQAANGYLVDKDGNVELPFTGKIHVAGVTTSDAKEIIRKEVDKYFNNAIVNVRYANFKITVLGEVARPSTFIIPNEKVSIFDALGMAGDITIFGKKENVVLLRDTAGQKSMVRLDLNSKEIVSSKWFYLQPNDIIYVEPNKYKVASVDAVRNRNITIVASALSVVLVIVSRLIN